MPIKYLAKNLKNNFFEKVHSFLFGMLGAVTVLLIAHYFIVPAKQIGTVNITGIVDQYIKQESKLNASPDVLKQDVKEFGKRLEKNLKELSKKNHMILLPSEAVIAGVPDYTSRVINSMQSSNKMIGES